MNNNPLLLFIIVRLLSTVFVQTWYVADEYWQATEIAHHMAFGYGYKTWEWQEGLRSALYPSLIALVFKLLHRTGIDSPLFLVHVPRILSAIAFGVGDFHVWKLSRSLYGSGSAHWTGVCLMTSWFLEYCAPRTLTSSAEMVLTSIALCYYPWRRQKETCDTRYLWLVGVACIIRPTAAIIFMPLCLVHVWLSQSRNWLLVKYNFTVITVICMTVALDSWYYNRLAIVPWEFANFNVISGLAAHYGTHPWHWYFTQGIPATLATHLVPFLMAVYSHFPRHRELLPLCLWHFIVYSCLGHKEFRFLLPSLPLCLCIAGDYINFTLSSYQKRTRNPVRWRSGLVLAWLIIPNLLMLLYLGLVHQRGPLDTMKVLQEEIETHKSPSVLFLMPCHSTPYYSYLHKNISMRFLTCEPNLRYLENYKDEADVFELDPLAWLHTQYGKCRLHKDTLKNEENTDPSSVCSTQNREVDGKTSRNINPMPSHILLFDVLANKIYDFLTQNKYYLCHTVFHAHIEDGRRDFVWCSIQYMVKLCFMGSERQLMCTAEGPLIFYCWRCGRHHDAARKPRVPKAEAFQVFGVGCLWKFVLLFVGFVCECDRLYISL